MKNLFPLLFVILIGFSACHSPIFSPQSKMKANVNGQSWKDNAPVLSFSPTSGRFELKGKDSDGTEIHLFSMQTHTDFELNDSIKYFSLPYCGFIDPLNPTQPPACTWMPGYAIQANQWQFGVVSSCEDAIAHYAFQLSTDMILFDEVARINALAFSNTQHVYTQSLTLPIAVGRYWMRFNQQSLDGNLNFSETAEVDVNGVYIENGVPHACTGSIHLTHIDTNNQQVSGSFALSTTLNNGQNVTIQSGTFENIPF